ncbi:glycosyltransferase family 39 protein [Mucilaginibacter sp. BJC16-A38]|uniref:ArnT family glycosyltransferase n=1 Tax=Mucilaginibacter phenanthrenivorans TaxID=1234842 RepID=UPI00215787AD|nr:glycosyltransferase family 39 protein [Mucilaginibacter phenanthrenivorans]MCR8557054.1 glycosyltransferase family 39 protein [Mucilaginibacter phenanthrenivorans]
MKKLTEGNAARSAAILIIITFIIRCLIAGYTGLGIGESYYFRGALNFDLSYFDQPPLFFWLSGISVKIFGLNNFGLRFPAVLLFAGTSWLMFLVTQKLFTAKAGFWAVAVMNLSAVFTVAIACWFQPDAPLMFFWMLATYYIVQLMVGPGAEKSEATRYSRRTWLLWLAVGISMGLATLSKYHVLFLFAGVFMFVVTNKSQRHWLRHSGPYLAVLITIIMAFPIIWWNAHNNWVSFVFQGSRAGANEEHFKLHFDWFFRSIGGQAAFLLPWIWFPIVRQLWISFKLRKQLLAYSFVFWMAILPIVFFTVVTLWSNLQFHFHWQAPGYMMLFIPLGFAVDRCLSTVGKGTVLTRRWINFSVYFTIITIGVLGTHMVTGFWQSYGPRWVVHEFHGDNNDPTIQGVDYVDIKTRFDKEGWTNNPNIFTGTPRWWLTGKVDWALKGKKDIAVFNNDARNLAFMVEPKKLVGKDCIIISDHEELDVNADAKPFFDSVTQLPDIDIVRSGRVEYKLQVFYGKNFHVPAQKRMEMPLYRQLLGLSPF